MTEALQQQTATADVLKVISRSAFDLDRSWRRWSIPLRLFAVPTWPRSTLREGDDFRQSAGTISPDSASNRLIFSIGPDEAVSCGRPRSKARSIHVAGCACRPGIRTKGTAALASGVALSVSPDTRGNHRRVRAGGRTVRPFTEKQIELVRASPTRPSSPSRMRACSRRCRPRPAI